MKIHPELLPPFVEFAPAYQPAPPVAVDLLIDKKSALTVPLAFDNVWLAAVTEPMVTKFPAVPDKLKLLNVLVVPAVNKTDVGRTVVVMSLNVFDPVMVNAPVPPIDRLLNVFEPVIDGVVCAPDVNATL